MLPARASVHVAICCAHPGCSELAVIEAKRSQGALVVVLPQGWTGVRNQCVERGGPYEVPALCPAHRPDVRTSLSRSIEEIGERIRSEKSAHARDLAARLARCARALERWSVVRPTDEQINAMRALVAELRAEVGLPRRLVTGVRRAVRKPTP